MRIFFGRLPKLKCGIAAVLLLAGPLLCAQENTESFGNKWTVMGMLNYRYLQYTQEGLFSCRTNTPFELGLGVGYRQFSLSFGIKLPFLHEQSVPVSQGSFDAGMMIVGGNFSLNAFIAAYSSFFMESPAENAGAALDFSMFSAGMSMRWVLAPQRISLRSVYNLDRRQLVSDGSFWLGFDNYFFSIQSGDALLREYEQRRICLYTGPAAGYVYTWILRNGMFLNVDFGGSVAMGLETGSKKFLLMPVVMPGITFGAHHQTWSFSLSLSANLFFSLGAGFEGSAALVPSRLSQTNATPIKVVKRF